MTDFDVPSVSYPVVPTADGRDFPVRRIFCVGKNYADHVKEMGGTVKADPPVYFTKPADAIFVPSDSNDTIPYPPKTTDLHYEGEFVVAIGIGGRDIDETESSDHIFGFALGCDLTRRDLQAAAKKRGGPWDMAKAFDHSAVIGPILPGADINPASELILIQNDEQRQRAHLDEMIYSVPKIIADLSSYVSLAPGDLIYTGTPSGVGPIERGDRIEISGSTLPSLTFWVR